MSRRAWFALLALVLLATALRLYRLQAQDIWGDEAFSIALSSRPLDQVIAGGADTHPPLYPALLFFWLRLAGTSAFATRALSVYIGILVVPLIFVFARRLANARVAWLAAILAAVSPLLIYYSQETRMYELVTLLSLASAYFLPTLWPRPGEMERGARKGIQRRRRSEYFLATLLALYTHYSAFFVLAAENLYILISWLRNRRTWGWVWARDWVLVQVLLLGSYAPWIAAQTGFLGGKANARFDEWGWRGVEMIFGKTLLAFGAGLTVEFPLAQLAAALFLMVAIAGAVPDLARRAGSRDPGRTIHLPQNSNAWALPALCFIIPVFIAWAVNPIMPFFFERYVLVALPGFYVSTALGLDRLARHWKYAAAGVAGMLFLVSAFSLARYFFDDAYAKGKYGQMMAFVSAHAQPGDILVLNNPLQKPLYEYYGPRAVPAIFMPDGAPLEDPQTRAQLAQVAATHRRVWLVQFGNPAEYDPTGYLERWLGTHAFKTESRGFVDARLSLYAMPAASPEIRREVRATLGESIRLESYDLGSAVVAPGETLQLTLHWQATAPVKSAYKVFTHLIGSANPATQSPVWAQMDGEPVGGSLPTTLWPVGQAIDDLYGLIVPTEAPPGEYEIEVGMYDPTTLTRLPVYDANGARIQDDRVILGTVTVR